MGALSEEERNGVFDVNAVGGNELETALIVSCVKNWLRLAGMLLDKGADVNKADIDGRTPLYRSCYNGNLELARLLLDKGADVNKPNDDGSTPLIVSCINGNLELARLLLDKGADVNKANKYGKTPLYWSCRNENLELTRLLLSKGADVNKASNNGDTPFYWSCRKDNLELARLLLSRGAKGNDTAQSSQVITQLAIFYDCYQVPAWLTARVGWHPMQYSCEVGWHLWSPSTHQHFLSTFRKGIVAMLLVDRRLKHQVGKDVLYHLLSYCGWDWFEVAEQQQQDEEGGGIGHRVSKRRKRVR